MRSAVELDDVEAQGLDAGGTAFKLIAIRWRNANLSLRPRPQLRRFFRGSHFTIGGHFPSLCPEKILAEIPALDSVVRFEAEETLAELANRVRDGEDWRDIPGIAYPGEDGVVKNDARRLIEDLDSLPFPYRPYEPGRIRRFQALPILASRGCVRRCSFCSIHNFYRNAPGRVVRIRKAEKVVEEVQHLHRRRGIRVFLFQDDDFPVWSARGRRWARELTDRLHDSGLAERTLWKISCRVEYVEPELFSMLRDAGLFLVYLGLESGNAEGVRVLRKELSTEQSLGAVDTLKHLGVSANFGFMLFDPSSSFAEVRENVDFLREIAGDGHSSVTFGRMMPYEGTAIRDSLQREGRLKGSIASPDYDFYDRRLNHYCLLLFRAVAPWLDKNGFSDGSIMPGTSWRPPGALSRTFEGTFGIQSWYEINRRILLFAALLPTGRYRQFRAEDILNDSDRVLRGEQARDARMGGPINVWRGSLYQPRDRGRAGAESPESCAGADSLDYLRARPSLSLSQIVALQRNRFEIKGDSPAIPWHEWYRMNQIFRKNRMVENLNRKSCKSC